MKAKKQFGQHFLIDDTVVHQIIEHISTHCSAEVNLLEVGPGRGVLTGHLVGAYENFRVVELDKDMIPFLESLMDSNNIIIEDFLRYDLNNIFEEKEMCIVGNFPYNISSQIIFKILENRDLVPTMVGMFQKEVARRICAIPGNKQNGILSLLTRPFLRARISL